MNVRFFLYNIELNFWHFIIHFLQSSPTLQYLVPRIYIFLNSKLFNEIIIPSLVFAALGLSFGFVIGASFFFG